jgi:hypothetical protein
VTYVKKVGKLILPRTSCFFYYGQQFWATRHTICDISIKVMHILTAMSKWSTLKFLSFGLGRCFPDVYNVNDNPVSLLFFDSFLVLLIIAIDKPIYLNTFSVARVKGLLLCHRPLLRCLPTPLLCCELFFRVCGHLTWPKCQIIL